MLAVFSLVFFAVITTHPFGRDFQIFAIGLEKAVMGENPYLPYSVGGGFVSHPILLLVVSILSMAGGSFRAMLIWIGVNIVAWFAAFQVGSRLLGERSAHLNLEPLKPDRLMFLLYLAALFAPFHETLYQGQVNGVVVLLLMLSFYLFEKQRDLWASLGLAGAIVLKTSPVFLLPYLLILRRYRAIAFVAGFVVILSLLPSLFFGLELLEQYGYIVSRLARAVEPSFYNESVLSIAYRSLDGLAIPNLATWLIWIHKAIVAAAHLTLLVFGLRRSNWDPSGRFWLFCTYLVLMTIASPLVWYHHSVFLLLPLLAIALSQSVVARSTGFLILLFIQFERFFEDNFAEMAWPVLLAHLILMGVMIRRLRRTQVTDPVPA